MAPIKFDFARLATVDNPAPARIPSRGSTI